MMQWSYDTLLKWGTDELTAHDVENAALDAWYLLEHIYGISRVDFLMRRSDSFDAAQMEKSTAYQALIRQRSEGVPVQYLTGSTEFMGLPFGQRTRTDPETGYRGAGGNSPVYDEAGMQTVGYVYRFGVHCVKPCKAGNGDMGYRRRYFRRSVEGC